MAIISGFGRDWQYETLDMRGRRTDISRAFGVSRIPSEPASWSPSGSHIAYRCFFDDDDTPYICEVEISSMTMEKYPLAEGGFFDDLTWSADGTGFLFVRTLDVGEPSELCEYNRTSRELTVLSTLPVDAGTVSWSPDRAQVAFATDGTLVFGPDHAWWEGQELYIQNVSGTFKKKICDDGDGAVWSPDGERLAFLINEGLGSARMCWALVKDGEVSCLAEPAHYAWSPDGSRIVIAGDSDIRIVNIHTGEEQVLLDGEANAYRLNWSPDGLHIAYERCAASEADQTCEIYVVSSDGETNKRLTRNSIADEFPVWQPGSIEASD